MIAFDRLTGIAAPFTAPNVDTDVIMPKQFLKGITRDGLAHGVFHDLRFGPDGAERPDFVLNTPPYRAARILVVGPNFGCGSSREHAVWGLLQFGIRALIGTTFAGIFHDNCYRNGLLPIATTADIVASLAALVGDGARAEVTIDLPEQIIDCDLGIVRFSIDPLRKDHLLRGLDAVGATLQWSADIRDFEQRHLAANPWLA